MKVIIVDDERQIREGLMSLIDFEALGCQVVGQGKNGKEGLELILTHKPDLCIIDIRMPEMNGIEVIEHGHKLQLSTKFIVLSGYGEFEYAKRAMACDVKDYVLKPIEESHLIELIKTHVINLDHRQKEEKVLKEQWLKRWINGEMEIIDMEMVNAVYGMKLPWKSYQLVLVELTKTSHGFVEGQLLQVFEKVVKHHGFIVPMGPIYAILMKDIIGDQDKGLAVYLREALEDEGILCRIVVSSAVYEHESVNRAYMEAEKQLSAYFLQHSNWSLGDSGKGVKEEEWEVFDEEEWFTLLTHSILTNHQPSINELLDHKLRRMLCKEMNEKEVIAAYVHLYIKLIKALSLEIDLEEENHLSQKIVATLVDMETLGNLHMFFKSKVMRIAEESARCDGTCVVSQLKTYIDTHYAMDLKIETMARFFGYNSAYLGKQFKKETGIYYNHYVDQVRIEAAKLMLKTSEDKIYEIAQALGYNDADYFTSKFKKIVGITPNRFRKK